MNSLKDTMMLQCKPNSVSIKVIFPKSWMDTMERNGSYCSSAMDKNIFLQDFILNHVYLASVIPADSL